MKKSLFALLFAFLILNISLAIAEPLEKQTAFSSDWQKSLALAENARDQGNYVLATKQFEAILMQATKDSDQLAQTMATAALGYNYYLARQSNKAQPLLEKAANLAKPLNAPALSALIDDYLGMLSLSQELPDKAANHFASALKNAQLAQNTDLIAGIRINQAKLETNNTQRLSLLKTASTEVLAIKDPVSKIKSLLSIAEQLLEISSAKLNTIQQQTLLKDSYQILNNAYQLADSNKQIRLRSQAEGYLGRLYATQKANQDALVWLEKALFDAQQVNATDLLMQWELQNGKLLTIKGELDAALQAYQRAAKHLVDIRYSLPTTFQDGHSSIKEIVDPIYRGMADILLLQASKASSNQTKQTLLKAAIDAMETIKQTELEDFFRDRCLIDDAVVINLKDALLPDVAVIYPIMLPNRLELLLRVGDSTEFEQKSVTVSSAEVINKATEIAERLHEGKGNYRPSALKLYDWLLKPYDESLKAKKITTIIYLPDGLLRQVPFAALMNGKKFVVEDYAVVTLPGLKLKKPVLNDRRANALIAALSKPDGASIDELMQSTLNTVEDERSITGIGQLPNNLAPKSAEVRASLVKELSLPNIINEVADLQKNMVNTTLLNKSFTYQGLKESVGSGNYSVIHIASHGYFGKSADDSFVMTYDRTLKLHDFQNLLNNENIKKTPIDLLTLSACQTANGDDHALLGFSGIAIKTNVLSAVGSLWSVDDAATATFMKNFYTSLNKLPKAQALQQAQLMLLKDNNLKHPYYWSPFVFVGNW
jgi:CHAT domain-containing protein